MLARDLRLLEIGRRRGVGDDGPRLDGLSVEPVVTCPLELGRPGKLMQPVALKVEFTCVDLTSSGEGQGAVRQDSVNARKRAAKATPSPNESPS